MDLETAVRSSPFATQFNTMDAPEQAALRGSLLKRLVALRLLRLEAVARGLDKRPEFEQEIEDYRTSRLYRYYIQQLREQLVIPEDKLQELKETYAGQADALAAAKASMLSEDFRQLRVLTLQMLREKQHVVFHTDRIVDGITQETLLMQGDKVSLSYGDIVHEGEFPKMPEKEWIEEQLYQRTELLLFAQAAADEGVDISAEVKAYKDELLPAMMMEELEKEWIPNEAALKSYFDANPDLAQIPERWHVGQLVVSSYAQAAAMKKRMEEGESLFALAGRYSIDPWGRAHNGDMGWFKEGEGVPVIEERLKSLADGEISDIIKTGKGYHLVTVLERRPGKVRKFAAMKDKVRQNLMDKELAIYLDSLQKKYPVDWKVLANGSKPGKADG
ncbi:peptidylprolyl isomerase [Thiolapillus brandeum]|uniref:peptidylprolyl isomerase n=1 Tax=Thiolapillus brandeum TaxID=1076588 RepID=UPI00155A58D8|nr:peptidylprolyl isomerase [Thiolapillus brandeum]